VQVLLLAFSITNSHANCCGKAVQARRTIPFNRLHSLCHFANYQLLWLQTVLAVLFLFAAMCVVLRVSPNWALPPVPWATRTRALLLTQ
jgi:hypothetical protein